MTTAAHSTPADWAASLSRRHHAADAAGWGLAALAVTAALAGGVMLAVWLERQAGNRNALDDAMLIDLPPPPPAMTAAAEAAPDAPMVDAPEVPDPAMANPEAVPELPVTEAAPAAPPVPDPLALAQLPDLPLDALAPPPPPEPVVEPLAEAKPERPPKPVPKPQKDAPAPSAASHKTVAKSSAEGAGQTTVSAGQIKDLKAGWGAVIRKKVERRKSYPVAAGSAGGTATVRLTVTRGGALAEASLVRSSGNPLLDAAALKAVQSAGAFPAAPKELTEASYAFTLPINFAR